MHLCFADAPTVEEPYQVWRPPHEQIFIALGKTNRMTMV